MIPLPGIRDKGGAPQLGATGPGTAGPYGWYGADEDAEPYPDTAHPTRVRASGRDRGRPTHRRSNTLSTIEWTGETLNPFTGCIRISPGCDNCYIETTPPFRMAHRRFNGDGPGSTTGVQLHPERLNIPRKRRKPETYFVNSLSDTFLAQIPVDYVTDVWRMMADTPRHTYQILTKRPERAARVLARVHDALGLDKPLSNVWLGTTVESADYARRIAHLRAAPAAVRFLSCEPLLGALPSLDLAGMDWVILGGESGPKSRPLELDWIRDVIGQCRTTGAAPFVKQLGTVWAKANGASDKKGGKPEDWPADLRVREYPGAA